MYSDAIQVLVLIVVSVIFIPWALRHLWHYFKNIKREDES